MPDWIDVQVQEQRRHDTLRDAERRRLIREIVAARPRTRFYRTPLVVLGRRLERWGTGLQARFGAMYDVPVVVSTEAKIS